MKKRIDTIFLLNEKRAKSESFQKLMFYYLVHEFKDARMEKHLITIQYNAKKIFPFPLREIIKFNDDFVDIYREQEPARLHSAANILLNMFETSAILDSELEWIDNIKTELTFWCWCHLKFSYSIAPTSGHCISETPTTPDECKIFIKEEFYRRYWITSKEKRIFLYKFKKETSNVLSQQLQNTWINKRNKERCQYAWNYLVKNNYKYSFLTPLTDNDIYHCLFAVLYSRDLYLLLRGREDLFNKGVEIHSEVDLKKINRTQEELINAIDKNWSQREFLKKRDAKKTSLTIDKKLLKELKLAAKEDKMPFEKYLKKMIDTS